MNVMKIALILGGLSAVSFSSELHADEASLRKTLSHFVETYNQKNAEKVAAFWSANATHTDRETGERTEGRQAIQADFAKVFADNPKMKLTATADRIRMITPDVAQVEGRTTIVSEDTDPMDSAYSAILVRQNGEWLFNSVEESEIPAPASSADALQELAWLTGNWVDESGDVKVKTTFRWSANQAFLLRSFSVESDDTVALEGTQIIGWDPTRQEIRSWTFDSDGSFGESTWSKNGSRWLANSTQTSFSGDVSSGTYVLEKIDDDSFSLQLIGHEINSEPQPAGPAVRLVRASEAPAVVPSSASR